MDKVYFAKHGMSRSLSVPVVMLLNMDEWGTTFAGRFRYALEQKNKRLSDNGYPALTQAELARWCGMSRANLSHWINGTTHEPAGVNVTAIALELDVDPHWLATGAGLPGRPAIAPTIAAAPRNVRPATNGGLSRSVPVVTFSEAGANTGTGDAIGIRVPTAAREFEDVESNVSEEAFALEVEGDAMEPLFPAGCRIIVEPTREAKTGDYVVARGPGWAAASFAQFMRDGGERYLKPTNPRYPVRAIGPDVVIVGVVVERVIRQTF